MTDLKKITIAIPTYCRGAILVETIKLVASQNIGGNPILILDQTPDYAPEINDELASLASHGVITWSRLPRPSITRAMNQALLEATTPFILFLDDDIVPVEGFVQRHLETITASSAIWAVVGQVLQPGSIAEDKTYQMPRPPVYRGLGFPFHSTRKQSTENVMAGNLSLNRNCAIKIGGFDENFEGSAYRFETDFAKRIVKAGGEIVFEPGAGIRHLRAPMGGTRSSGSHLTSASGMHGMGDYYYALKCGFDFYTLLYVLKRPVREVTTLFHLKHPWWIPVKLIGEMRALARAIKLWRKGAKLLPCDKQVQTKIHQHV